MMDPHLETENAYSRDLLGQDWLIGYMEKLKNHAPALSTKDLSLAQMPAFFDGIVIHQQPYFHQDWFTKSERPFTERPTLTSKLTMPLILEDNKELTPSVQFTNLYNKEKL